MWFEGPYESWAAAATNVGGWEDEDFLSRTLEATLRVRSGEVEFQQDTVVKDQIVYSTPILAMLAMACAFGGSDLRILDFGGALGTNFFQNRRVLAPFLERGACKWDIVETAGTVRLGRAHLEDAVLGFHEGIETPLAANPSAVLFSGSLQCIPNPQEPLDAVFAAKIPIVAFDRLLVSSGPKDLFFVQRLNPAVLHEGSYALTAFSRERFVERMVAGGYRLAAAFDPVRPHLDHVGLIFQHAG